MILSLEQVKNWIKTIAPETAGKIAVGNIDGNKEYFVGVYDGKRPPPQRICIGGYEPDALRAENSKNFIALVENTGGSGGGSAVAVGEHERGKWLYDGENTGCVHRRFRRSCKRGAR